MTIALWFSEQFLCGYVSSGFQSRPLTAQSGMLHPTEPQFSHLENGTNRLTLVNLQKPNQQEGTLSLQALECHKANDDKTREITDKEGWGMWLSGSVLASHAQGPDLHSQH